MEEALYFDPRGMTWWILQLVRVGCLVVEGEAVKSRQVPVERVVEEERESRGFSASRGFGESELRLLAQGLGQTLMGRQLLSLCCGFF